MPIREDPSDSSIIELVPSESESSGVEELSQVSSDDDLMTTAATSKHSKFANQLELMIKKKGKFTADVEPTPPTEEEEDTTVKFVA